MNRLLLLGFLLLALLTVPRARAFLVTLALSGTQTVSPAIGPAETELVTCSQVASNLRLQRNHIYTGSFYRCTNHWHQPVQIQIVVEGSSGTGLYLYLHQGSVAAGQSSCLPGAYLGAIGTVADSPPVLYRVTATAPGLALTGHFTGAVTVTSGAQSPLHCS